MVRVCLLCSAQAAPDPAGHGPAGTRENPPLSAFGAAQAQRTAERFSSQSVRAVYSSDLTSATQTAAIVDQPHGLPVVRRAGFNEVGFGVWAEQTVTDVEQGHDGRHSGKAEDAGLLEGAVAGAFSELESIVREVPEGLVVVVAHETINRLVLCSLLGYPLSDYERIGQTNAAVNVLLWEQSFWMVECINDDLHLAGLNERPQSVVVTELGVIPAPVLPVED